MLSPVVYANAWVDYAVREVTASERRSPRGIFDRDGGPVTVEDAGPVEPEEWESAVLVTRRGTISVPVNVRVVFDDGTVRQERWDGRGTFSRFSYRSRTRVARAEVDPERRVVLDADLRNNGRGREPGGAPRVFARALYAIAALLQAVGP